MSCGKLHLHFDFLLYIVPSCDVLLTSLCFFLIGYVERMVHDFEINMILLNLFASLLVVSIMSNCVKSKPLELKL